MSDIVEELRKGCEFGPDYPLDPESFMCHRIECKAADEIDRLRSKIARIRESLAIFVHAHATGNSVPPHLEEQAKLLVEGGGA